jgi:hypothetical protein
MQLRDNVVFTEEEYKDLFMGSKEFPMAKVKELLYRKGLMIMGNSIDDRERAAENFIFNSIPRENNSVSQNLFFSCSLIILKSLSCEDVFKFVSQRRYIFSKKIRYYLYFVVGLIFSHGNNNFRYNFRCIEEIYHGYFNRGKKFIPFLSFHMLVNYDAKKCSCDEFHLMHHFGTDNICLCCANNIVSFAEDCTIKLGRKLLTSNFLLFQCNFKDELVGDILNFIGLKMFM